jgi:endonuclease YncB( thermonuclease family)
MAVTLSKSGNGQTLDRVNGLRPCQAMIRILVILAAIGAAMCCPARAAGLPDCAGKVEIAHAHIVRVEKNGALILNDGRAVLLEGIRLPQGAGDHAPSYIADEALAALRELAMAAPLELASTPPKQDRYDRVRVQAFDKSIWLQIAMLEKGLARVAIAPDRQECFPELYGAEQRARQAGVGLWASPAYRIRQQAPAAGDIGSFQIVEGRIAHVDARPGRAFLDFSNDAQRGFSAIIEPADRKAFRDLDPPLEGLAGRRVRLRGLVQAYNGRPEILLSNPVQIELLN